MKRLIVCTLLIACLLSGCENAHPSYKVIEYRDDLNLVYMTDSTIVYYKDAYKLAPYYSENGKLCRYIDGKIVEIDN